MRRRALFRSVPRSDAIIILYLVTALLGAVVYLYFKVHIQPDLERDRLLYVVARAYGLALFTVYPSLGVVLLGMHRSRDVADPAMAMGP